MPRRECLALSILLLVLNQAPNALAYEELGLRLRTSADLTEIKDLERGSRLRTIDALEEGWDSLSPEEIVQREEEIALLFAGSDLIKHRVWAIEMIEEQAVEDRPAIPTLAIRGAVLEEFLNYRGAVRAFSDIPRIYPDSALAHREAGRARLDFGLHLLDPELLLQARKDFERAAECSDTTSEDLTGLAAVLVALDDREALRQVARRLLESDPNRPSCLLYAALAAERSGRVAEAERLFHRALDQLSPALRDWFEGGEEFFRDFELPSFVHTPVLGEISTPPSLLRWWVRLVETEILFGDPRIGLNGWNSAAGQVYLRYGAPKEMAYQAANTADGELLAVRFRKYGLQFSEIHLDQYSQSPGYWVWLYDMNGTVFPIIFEKYNELARWRMTRRGQNELAAMRQALPFYLPPRDFEDALGLNVRYAAFRAPHDRVRVEAYLALRRAQARDRDPEHEFRVTLTVSDLEGGLVDRVSHLLDTQQSRGRLLDMAGLPRTDDRTILHQFGADLPPGQYVVTLEVEDLLTGEYRAHERAVELTPKAPGMEISDLQLCDAFHTYSLRMQLPVHFVKYAHAVIPHPEFSVASAQDGLFVYYEVYDAQLDETQHAQLDVIYEIFRKEEFEAFEAGLPAGMAARVPAFRAQFERQRTGRSAQGIVVKGTRLDVSELEPGPYVLAVSVTDRLARTESQRFTEFTR